MTQTKQDALVATVINLNHFKVWSVEEFIPDAFAPQLLP